MTDETKITSLAQLFHTTWIWMLPLFGGIGDYIIQAQRGLKPRTPLKVVMLTMGLHSVVAVFSGMVVALCVGAVGYTGEMAYAAAGAIGGFLGVRVFDIGVLFIRMRAGAKGE